MRDFSFARIPKPVLPFDISQFVPNEFLDLEIGAGSGLHAIRYCQTNPLRKLIAVEKTHTRFARLETRLKNHPELNNLCVLHADAVAFVSHYLPAAALDRVFLLYPNPYPKAKQANLRWHNRPFVALLVTKIKPGGRLTLATNLKWYAEEAAVAMVKNFNFTLTAMNPVDPLQTPRTHFEKKYLARNEQCWNLEFHKPF